MDFLNRVIGSFVRGLYYTIVSTRIFITFFIMKLKHDVNNCSNIADCVDLAFSFFRSFLFKRCNIRPSQERKEITEFLQVLSRYRLETILEIGTASGGTLFLFAKLSNPDAKLISIDLPEGLVGEADQLVRVAHRIRQGLDGVHHYGE